MHSFGAIVKQWRALRRHSQLDLALEAGLSARHLSFLETGRAQPSRSMVLRLAHALNMPGNIVNQALHHAGFAPAYPALASDAPDLEPIHRALDLMLQSHDPLPAIVIDRYWTIARANNAASRLFGFAGGALGSNMIDLLLHAHAAGLLVNAAEVALMTLARLRAELAEIGHDERLAAMIDRLAQAPLLGDADWADIAGDRALIPLQLQLGEQRLALFSSIAQFSTVLDTRASELRAEMMFPADDATRAFFAAFGD